MRFWVSSMAAALLCANTATADLIYSSRLSYDHVDLSMQQLTASYAGAKTDGEGINIRASGDFDGVLIQGGFSETTTDSSTDNIDFQRAYIGAGRHWTLAQNFNRQTSIYTIVGVENLSVDDGPVSESFSGVFAAVGLRSLLGPQLEARVEASYHNLDGDGIDDRIDGFAGLVEVLFRFTDHFGVGLSYDVTQLQGDSTNAEIDLESLILFVRYYFK